MPLIICRDLALGYNGRKILSGLNFAVNAGEYLCIVGENGSGKSTLVKTLLGLQPPLGGQIELDESLAAGGIGYLPQQTEVQRDFPASVWEVVLSGCQSCLKLYPFYGAEEKARAAANLERVGLTALKRRCYRELSGGQQQRVLLARALCAANRFLLLDEPVSGLDPDASAQLYRQIRELNRGGVTILMVTHDLPAALADATHVLHIGDVPFMGTKAEYLRCYGKGRACNA